MKITYFQMVTRIPPTETTTPPFPGGANQIRRWMCLPANTCKNFFVFIKLGRRRAVKGEGSGPRHVYEKLCVFWLAIASYDQNPTTDDTDGQCWR
jgi:hypothetical protein